METLSVVRWARLQLPNGQIARSAWKEGRRALNKVRMARNVKFLSVSKHHLGEIQFFFRAQIDGVAQAFALIDHYSDPDEEILQKSYKTVWLCDHGQGKFLIVIPAKTIISVVAMFPHSLIPGALQKNPNAHTEFILVEKPGLDIMKLSGYFEGDEEADEGKGIQNEAEGEVNANEDIEV
ncbi:hypothetical protein C8F04DRAFT_982266 [Mycena alexandri]|uniref:Uncharacterized protein n=1 Tax=Mycena alexandri TaxID=1745969 RepID=A0AAD6RWS9_9AGAR|nr:hypothetical protein C8F04DRAFT_982266 [Mycena alexandri]